MQDRAKMIGVFQPKQQHLWDIIIPGVPGLDGHTETLQLSLKSAGLPSESTGEVKVPMDSSEVKFAGKTSFENISLMFSDYIDRNTAALIRNWRSKVFDPITGGAGLVAQYKLDGYAKVYSDQTEEYIATYALQGAWPSTGKWGDLDRSSAELVQISVTLVIDRGYMSDGMGLSR
jgi:hypothetical protein